MHRLNHRRMMPAVDSRSRLAARQPLAALAPWPAEADVLVSLVPRPTAVFVERNGEIVIQGESAEACYLVVTGCVRTVRRIEDGSRHVGEFLFPGDLFGWESLEEHDFGAEAVTLATLNCYVRRDIEAFADRDRDFCHRLRALMARRVRAGREHMILPAHKTASERIAYFLVEMAERMNPDMGSWSESPAERNDVADYLGLTRETVSHHLAKLRRRGTTAVDQTKIRNPECHTLAMAGGESSAL